MKLNEGRGSHGRGKKRKREKKKILVVREQILIKWMM